MLTQAKKKLGSLIILICATIFFISYACACTRVLLVQKDQPVLVGNNMDWFEDMHANLFVYPAGIERAGLPSGKALNWKARFGSIVATAYDDLMKIHLTTNGMNERGLGVHLLGLKGSDFGARDTKVAGLSILLWAQYYLDNFATVAEALRFTETENFQVVTMFHPKIGVVALHLVMEDSTGDSALIEYIDGKRHIYHNRQYTVVTNEPTFDWQLENIKNYAGFGGELPLPGTTFARDRFVRALYYSANLSGSKSTREAVLKLFSVMQNAGQPYGSLAPERTEHGRIFESLWRSVSDLTNRVYYFNSTMSFNTIWVQLDKLNLSPGAPILRLNLPEKLDLAGDVTGEFEVLSS
jgi:penicillin V acylase-like amidase (Ntn superfamily)